MKHANHIHTFLLLWTGITTGVGVAVQTQSRGSEGSILLGSPFFLFFALHRKQETCHMQPFKLTQCQGKLVLSNWPVHVHVQPHRYVLQCIHVTRIAMHTCNTYSYAYMYSYKYMYVQLHVQVYRYAYMYSHVNMYCYSYMYTYAYM